MTKLPNWIRAVVLFVGAVAIGPGAGDEGGMPD